ncbi:hypothetical protein GCM10018777_13930 [Streptomyces albogriseolus]|nr:hypothetical protein GCM10018777_13930 [Streptomyces viridodiastaticus]
MISVHSGASHFSWLCQEYRFCEDPPSSSNGAVRGAPWRTIRQVYRNPLNTSSRSSARSGSEGTGRDPSARGGAWAAMTAVRMSGSGKGGTMVNRSILTSELTIQA